MRERERERVRERENERARETSETTDNISKPYINQHREASMESHER